MGDVGKEVRRLREAKGWGQTKLAAAADMAVSGVSQIENGRRNPNSATLIKLAKALEVEVADLFPKVEAPLWSEDSPERPTNDDPGQGFLLLANVIRAAADMWSVDAAIQDISDAEIAGRVQAIRDLYIGIANVVSPKDSSEPSGWEVLTMWEEDELKAVMDKLRLARNDGLDRLEKAGYREDENRETPEQRRDRMKEWTRHIA